VHAPKNSTDRISGGRRTAVRTLLAYPNDLRDQQRRERRFYRDITFTASATAGTNTSVSNWSLQFVQDQKLRTSRSSLKYSDHSGPINVSPHFLQAISWLELRMDATVAMITSLLLLIVFAASSARMQQFCRL
jgi:hypothetical protein